ncbi:hypothetical protein CEE39_06295 [bacterium (candidate division B38) B3_B38]|nr:MAG: hypothetical protein CEE39_06295 [bacterium (candidate division B38) B3_B38]
MLKNTDKEVTPDKLYSAMYIQRFINKCRERKVEWAILSDLYGVWFPNVKHKWYEKDPDKVTFKEFRDLLNDFDQKLKKYDEIWFYYNPGRFHILYNVLLEKTKLKYKVQQFTHIKEIVKSMD